MATTGMPWFRLEPEFESHPKVRLLCRRLSDPNASIYVIRLWCWTAAFFPKGRIEADDSFLETELKWIGERGQLVAALIEEGLLDRDRNGSSLSVHGWQERNAKQYDRFLKDRKRHKNKGKSDSNPPQDSRRKPAGASTGFPQEPPAENAGASTATVRNGTVRNGTKEQDPPVAGTTGSLFDRLGDKATGARPGPKADKPKQSAEEREQERVDGDRWKAAYLAGSGTRPEDFDWGSAWHTFTRARKRRGIDSVLTATRGLGQAPRFKGKGPGIWLSNDALTEGLNAVHQGPANAPGRTTPLSEPVRLPPNPDYLPKPEERASPEEVRRMLAEAAARGAA